MSLVQPSDEEEDEEVEGDECEKEEEEEDGSCLTGGHRGVVSSIYMSFQYAHSASASSYSALFQAVVVVGEVDEVTTDSMSERVPLSSTKTRTV